MKDLLISPSSAAPDLFSASGRQRVCLPSGCASCAVPGGANVSCKIPSSISARDRKTYRITVTNSGTFLLQYVAGELDSTGCRTPVRVAIPLGGHESERTSHSDR